MTSTPIIAIHGGAGTIDPEVDGTAHRAALCMILLASQEILQAGGRAIDAVVSAVKMLEDCELFNAGYGAVFTSDETHELDAAVMDGETLRAGAVAYVSRIRHPVLAARAVMDDGAHVLLVGTGAEVFAGECGLEMVEPSFFSTEARREQLRRKRAIVSGAVLDHDGAAQAAKPPDEDSSTVGAVALDMHGHVAAATSTGGMTNKRPGRVGDSPLIGAGTYADDRSAAVSCTGGGEMFIRITAAHDVCARMAYSLRTTLEDATDAVLKALGALEGQGGLIAVDRSGNLCMPFTTDGMYRGYARGTEAPHTAIRRESPTPCAFSR
jgi:beta-aspartyl-peptidase (threonine type)